MFLMTEVNCHKAQNQRDRALSGIDFDLTKSFITYPADARDWLLEGAK